MIFTGGLTNPRPWRGRCRAGFSNTGGPPLPRKRAPLQKNMTRNTKEDTTARLTSYGDFGRPKFYVPIIEKFASYFVFSYDRSFERTNKTHHRLFWIGQRTFRRPNFLSRNFYLGIFRSQRLVFKGQKLTKTKFPG